MSDDELFEDYYFEDQVARLMVIKVSTLRNKISAGKDHPPFVGRGKGKRFPKDEFHKWERKNLTHQRNSA